VNYTLRISAGLAAVSFLWSFIFLPLPTYAAGLQCEYLFLIQTQFLKDHLNYKHLKTLPPDVYEILETRTIEQYVKSLDRSKLYLLEADVVQVKTKLRGILAKVKDYKCDTLYEIDTLLGKRIKERADFTAKYLASGFKFEPKTEIILDPEKRSFAKDTKELDEYHKKYLQFQISTYLQTDMALTEAKGNVIRRYQRGLKKYESKLEASIQERHDEIFDLFLNSFAKSLDPHSNYLSQDTLEDFSIQMSLSLEGIGATLSFQDGFTVIEQLIPGGAAGKSGKLQPKDKIIAVGQGESGTLENVVEVELRDVVKKIRGAKNTKVRLSVLRKTASEQSKFEVILVRDKISLEDDAASITYVDREIGGVKRKVALVNLPSFYSGSGDDSRFSQVRSCAKDMKKLLKEARQNNVDAILLDLSTNGGGSLDDAVSIGGLFFKKGGVVKEIGPEGEKIRADDDAEVDWSGPLVVLTSRISASASEIVAGTLQDYDRAIIVGGDHTFGKGTIQSVRRLPSKLGATKVTVGMFFIPGGTTTQHKGVDADIVFPGVFSTDDVGEKTLDYSLAPKTTQPFISPDAFVTNGAGKWDKVKPEVLKEIREVSLKRISQDSEFKKVVEEIKKAKDQEKNKTTKLSELMKEKTDIEKKEKEEKKSIRYGSKEEKMAEYMKRSDIKESLNIAFDFVQLQKGAPIMLGEVKVKPDRKSMAPESKDKGEVSDVTR